MAEPPRLFRAQAGESLASSLQICYITRPTHATNSAMGVLVRVIKEALLGAMDVKAAIERLANEFASCCGTADARAVTESALGREALESTYVGRSLAVPHARICGLPEAGVCIAPCDPGIPWPNEAARLVVLLVVPMDAPGLYLQLLSHIMRWRMKGGSDPDSLARELGKAVAPIRER